MPGLSQSLPDLALVIVEPTGIDHLLLQSENYTTAVQEEACIDITANTSVIVGVGGDVVFRAGTSVILEPGFSVNTGGVFTVDISLPTGCVP